MSKGRGRPKHCGPSCCGLLLRGGRLPRGVGSGGVERGKGEGWFFKGKGQLQLFNRPSTRGLNKRRLPRVVILSGSAR